MKYIDTSVGHILQARLGALDSSKSVYFKIHTCHSVDYQWAYKSVCGFYRVSHSHLISIDLFLAKGKLSMDFRAFARYRKFCVLCSIDISPRRLEACR